MDVLELLKGKKMRVMTDMKVEVELEIQEVKQNNHSEDLEPATRENDFWPPSRNWTTFTVTFTNGAKKQFNNINEINVL
jgi:hypothetical protein